MLWRDVQRIKVIPIRFDLRAFGDGKAHIGEDRGQFFHHLADRMNGAPDGAADPAGPHPAIPSAGVRSVLHRQPPSLGAQGCVNLILQDVQHGTGCLALIRLYLAKAGHQRRNLALLAKGCTTQIL